MGEFHSDGSELLLSSVQHASTSDGPGLRTTVFFAGCNLHCGWCHNPETQSFTPSLLYYETRCARCGICSSLCPSGAMSGKGDGHRFDRSLCLACGRCTELCPAGAVVLSHQRRTVDSVMAEIEKDTDFYRSSRGGVTLSGGEPLLQPDAAERLARLCREKEIHVLLDTAGCVSSGVWQRLSPLFDEIYLDLKCPDEESFRRHTGGDLSLVLENMRFSAEAGQQMTVRVPVIPGVNLERLEELAELAAAQGARRLCLLPFHRLGSGKYSALGLSYAYAGFSPLDRKILAEKAESLRASGLEITTE